MKRALVALALLGLVGALAACGVPEDEGPEALSADEVPFGLLTTVPSTTTTVVDLPPDREAELFFLAADGRVRGVPREVEDRSPTAVLEALLATEAAAVPTGFSSAIPAGTELLDDPEIEDGVLTVDLSEEFTSVEGERSIAAVAQIVYTATGLSSVDAVAFRVEGEPVSVSDEDGAQQSDPVDRLDYDSLVGL